MKNKSIEDLSASQELEIDHVADYCIVGAGAIGIYLATQLTKLGYLVTILEGGGLSAADSEERNDAPLFIDQQYHGATNGRYFGLGGSTAKWGGVLIPHTKEVGMRNGNSDSAWKYIYRAIDKNQSQVLKMISGCGKCDFNLTLNTSLNSIPTNIRDNIIFESPIVLPFLRKNFRRFLHNSSLLKVFINATVVNWEHDDLGAITKVTAASSNLRRVSVRAEKFIIAAGALESARILLEMKELDLFSTIPITSEIGKNLSDHLSVSVATVDLKSQKQIIKLFSPQFSGKFMRIFRMIDVEGSKKYRPAFFHFIFADSSNGLLFIKELMRSFQAHHTPNISFKMIVLGFWGLLKLFWHRYILSSLYVPADSKIYLQIDIEQIPSQSNYLRLSSKKNSMGRKILEINWKISDEDKLNIVNSARLFRDKWEGSQEIFPKISWVDLEIDALKPHDAYHPAGVTRMGDDIGAVVDLNLKVNGFSNLWAISTGVLPSIGSSNPTFTMLCLAQEFVESQKY